MDDHLNLEVSPFQRLLGLQLVESTEGRVVLRMPFGEAVRRHNESDWVHGGAIASLIDIAGDYALITRLGVGLPTIDLRVDWLRPARNTELLAEAKVVKVGRTICVADVEVRDEAGKLVAVGRGSYATPRP